MSLLLHLWNLIAPIWIVSPYIFSCYCCSGVIISSLRSIPVSVWSR
uniref:Uncharacterized protein n=1 Tax=Arundo donax TaxID=35708 RepID=A0A0A8Z223_ARUDO